METFQTLLKPSKSSNTTEKKFRLCKFVEVFRFSGIKRQTWSSNRSQESTRAEIICHHISSTWTACWCTTESWCWWIWLIIVVLRMSWRKRLHKWWRVREAKMSITRLLISTPSARKCDGIVSTFSSIVWRMNKTNLVFSTSGRARWCRHRTVFSAQTASIAWTELTSSRACWQSDRCKLSWRSWEFSTVDSPSTVSDQEWWICSRMSGLTTPIWFQFNTLALELWKPILLEQESERSRVWWRTERIRWHDTTKTISTTDSVRMRSICSWEITRWRRARVRRSQVHCPSTRRDGNMRR